MNLSRKLQIVGGFLRRRKEVKVKRVESWNWKEMTDGWLINIWRLWGQSVPTATYMIYILYANGFPHFLLLVDRWNHFTITSYKKLIKGIIWIGIVFHSLAFLLFVTYKFIIIFLYLLPLSFSFIWIFRFVQKKATIFLCSTNLYSNYNSNPIL